MFETLDDPTPIAPSPRHHVAVAQRAAELRRRRRAVLALPAVALFLVAMGAGAVALRNSPTDSVTMGTTDTNDLGEPEERRDELIVVGGARVIDDETANDPESGSFQRFVRFELADGGLASVMRVELRADEIADMKAQLGGTPTNISPTGRPYFAVPDDANQVVWFPTDNLAVTVGSSDVPDVVALLDSLDYEAPRDLCVEGVQVRSSPLCNPFDSLLEDLAD